jgi:hypothetical protein
LLNQGDDEIGTCCKKSVVETLIIEEKELHGILHIAWSHSNVCECCGLTFQIQGITQTHELYVKLPKEDMYVRACLWEHEYTKSQVQELIYIFRMLGATELDITVYQSDQRQEGLDVDIGLEALGISVHSGGRVRNSDKTIDTIHARLRFDDDNDNNNDNDINNDVGCVDVQLANFMKLYQATKLIKRHPVSTSNKNKSNKSKTDIFDDPTIFYLHQKPDWMNFVRERLNGGVREIAFDFVHHNILELKKSFCSKINKIGVRLEWDNKNKTWIRMEFKARFKSPKHKKKISIISV